MTRYTLRPARRPGVFWSVVTAVVLVGALAQISEALAVAVVLAVIVGALILAAVRAWSRHG